MSLLWKNNGPLSGGGGGIVPENVVTAEGGAAMLFTGLGGPPFSVEFVDEEEPPLTAADITYQDESVEEALSGLFTSVSSGKARIASAITDKGVPTQEDATFADMAENIRQIPTGTGTGDATATPGDILSPKTAYTATGKVEGVIPTLAGRTITPGTGDQMIANGQYLGGSQIIKGDPNLTSANIKKGVSIFGVAGAVEQTFLATLTVTVDVGAVVTARNGSTKVSALSTTGSVTLELPIEGQWTVTAVRGVTQYNSLVLDTNLPVQHGKGISLSGLLQPKFAQQKGSQRRHRHAQKLLDHVLPAPGGLHLKLRQALAQQVNRLSQTLEGAHNAVILQASRQIALFQYMDLVEDLSMPVGILPPQLVERLFQLPQVPFQLPGLNQPQALPLGVRGTSLIHGPHLPSFVPFVGSGQPYLVHSNIIFHVPAPGFPVERGCVWPALRQVFSPKSWRPFRLFLPAIPL